VPDFVVIHLHGALLGVRMWRPLVLGLRIDEDDDAAAGFARLCVTTSPRLDLLYERLDGLHADMFRAKLLAAETQDHLDLHAFAKEIDRVVQLECEVVRVDVRAKLDLLDFDRDSGFFLLLAEFFLLVGIFSVVGDPADRRLGIGGNLDQIQPLLLGHSHGFLNGMNP
ncbi:uncharacterized protein METZ01_LOCUS92298, partial [marine metagenome]